MSEMPPSISEPQRVEAAVASVQDFKVGDQNTEFMWHKIVHTTIIIT